jgi:hypothetical protein
MTPIRIRPLLAIAALATLLAGCVVYDPAPPAYYGPGYAYAPPVYGGVVIGGGYYGGYHRRYWR